MHNVVFLLILTIGVLFLTAAIRNWEWLLDDESLLATWLLGPNLLRWLTGLGGVAFIVVALAGWLSVWLDFWG